MFRKGKTFKALILSMFLIIGSISSSIVFADETKGAPNEAPVITEDNSVQDVEKIAETNEASQNEAAETVATEKTEDSSVQDVEEPAETNEVSQNEAAETVTNEKTEDVKPEKEIKGAVVKTQAKAPQNQPAANGTNKVYIEILPEIFLKSYHDGVTKASFFSNPDDAIGVGRSPDVYGSFPANFADIENAWLNVYFNVYDENGNLIERTKGTIGDHNRWGGTKYLGPYDRGHNYTVSVDTSTLPKGYCSWVTSNGGGQKKWPEDVMTVDKTFQVATYDKSFDKDFAALRFHLDIMSFSFARNEEVAKDQFILDNAGKPTKRNPKWKNGSDYILKPVSVDGKLVAPTKEEMENLADEGYRPNGFYAYAEDKNGEFKAFGFDAYVLRDVGYSYLQRRAWNDNHGINTRNKFKYSSVYTLVLDQSIPEVTFDWNENGKDDPQNRTVLNVYYNKSLKTNSVSKDDKGLPKTLPKAPAKEGKVFAGWNTKQDGTGVAFTEDTVVTDDITVYAQWKDKEYTITVDPNGGNWNGDTAIKTQQIKENETFKLPEAPTKEGKVFAGWNTKQDGTGVAFTEDTVVTDDITVYAQWKDKEYTITVDPNGGNWNGDTAIKTQQFKENEEFTLPEAPTKDGYTFLYWKGSQYQPGQVYVVKEDHKFTAEWNKKPALEVKNTTIKVGDEIDLRTLIETAMDEEDGQNLIDKVLIDKGDFDSKKAGKYKVTFTLTDSNGASVTKEAIVTVAEKDKPTPKPDNKPQEPNNKLFPQTGDSSNMTLYASLLVLSGALLAVVALRRRKES